VVPEKKTQGMKFPKIWFISPNNCFLVEKVTTTLLYLLGNTEKLYIIDTNVAYYSVCSTTQTCNHTIHV